MEQQDYLMGNPLELLIYKAQEGFINYFYNFSFETESLENAHSVVPGSVRVKLLSMLL